MVKSLLMAMILSKFEAAQTAAMAARFKLAATPIAHLVMQKSAAHCPSMDLNQCPEDESFEEIDNPFPPKSVLCLKASSNPETWSHGAFYRL
jgi:hypothetical protein